MRSILITIFIATALCSGFIYSKSINSKDAISTDSTGKSIKTVEGCDIELPEGTRVEYSEARKKYVISIMRYGGKQYMHDFRSSGFMESSSIGEYCLFSDSCEAKERWKKYANEVELEKGTDFK